MLFIWIALLTVSLIVYISDTKSESNRYVSLAILFLSFGSAADTFRAYVIPLIATEQPAYLGFSLFFNGFLYTVSIYFPFYFILLYSISYSEIVKFKYSYHKLLLKAVLLIPSVSMYIFVPITPPVPKFSTNYIYLSIWTIPYMLCTHALLIAAFIKEKHRLLKIERLVNMLFIIPIQIILICSEIIIPIFKLIDNDFLHVGLAICLVLYFSFFTVRVSFFGVRIILQKNRSMYEKRMFDSSLSIFNHAVKNEISKISLCATFLKEHSYPKDNTTEETVDIIIDSSYHLLNMINKMNYNAQIIVPDNDCIDLKELITDVVNSNKLLLEEKQITLEYKIQENYHIFCDKVHLSELLNNIITNAIEAVNNKGNIIVETSLSKKYLSILIKDDGYGILESDIKKVTEPFFSTKKGKQNYGLGLYYCKKVIESHGGFLEIKSHKDIGTEVYVFFPSKKVYHGVDVKQGSEICGYNQNRNCGR